MKDYEDRIRADPARGAILLAVCRGKISEGLDFADAKARAVVVTGIPYAPAMDPKVVLKREQLDQQSRLAKQLNQQLQRQAKQLKQAGGPTAVYDQLSGGEWYSQQALRAVNQALGRVIRHRHDWGAVLLCDERFASAKHMECLSSWIRPHIEVFGGGGGGGGGGAGRALMASSRPADRAPT